MKKFSVLFLTTALVFGFSLMAHAQEEASAASLYNQGLEKAKAKQYVEALALMEQAIAAANPEDEKDAKVINLAKRNGTRAAYGAGVKHRKAKDYDAALAAFERGIEFNPDYYTNYKGKAQTLEAQGNTLEAVKAYITGGNVAVKTNKADKAAPLFSKAENIVAVTWGKKDWDNTIAYAQAIIEAEKESAEIYYYLADALQAKGQTSDAAEKVAKAIELAGEADTSKYYFLKAEIHEKQGQTAEAIDAYKKVKDAKYAERAKFKVDELGGGR